MAITFTLFLILECELLGGSESCFPLNLQGRESYRACSPIGLVSLQEETLELTNASSLCLSLCLQGYVTQTEGAIYQPGRESSPAPTANILILDDIKFPDLRKNKFLFFKPLSLHYFVTAALADQYNLWLNCSFHLTLRIV